MDGKKKLLVIELHHLGDALLSFPFIRSAAKQFDVWVCCRRDTALLFKMILPSNRIVFWEGEWPIGISKTIFLKRADIQANLKKVEFDSAVTVWADPRVYCLMTLLRIPQRVGLSMTKENYYGWPRPKRWAWLVVGNALMQIEKVRFGERLLTHIVQRRDPNQSHLDSWVCVAKSLGLDLDVSIPWFDASRFAQKRSGYWVCHNGGNAEEKRWPVEGWQGVLHKFFVRYGIPVKFLLRPDERKRHEKVQQGSQTLIEEVYAESLTEIIALVYGACAVLTTDTFVGHLGAALGKPVVTLFGNANPCWFCPVGQDNLTVGKRKKLLKGGQVPIVNLETAEVKQVIEKMESVSLSRNS